MNMEHPLNIFSSGQNSGPDRDFLLSLFPESEVITLASKLGDDMEGRIATFLTRRLDEAVVKDETIERSSYAAKYLDSFMS